MRIVLSPQAGRSETLTLSRQGDILVINGAPLDLSQVAERATLPAEAIASEWIVGAVTRIEGVLQVTVLLPYADEADEAVRFPAPITVTADGPIVLPTGPSEPVPTAPAIAVDWSQLALYETPAPIVVHVPAHVFFARCSDEEAEALDEVMMGQTLRLRRQWMDPSVVFSSNGELWAILRAAIVDLYGEARADELLADPSASAALVAAEAEPA